MEIEHYEAKTIRPERAFEWTNLFPACRECNGSKGNSDHQGRLLKPDMEDPEPYFWINAGTGELQPHPRLDEAGRQRALGTIALCNLQRGPLCVKRLDMWMRAGAWLNLMEGPAAERQPLLDPHTEYKLVVRQAFERGGHSAVAEEDRRRFEAPPQTISSFTGSQRTLRSRR
jgi:hypothetical protein